MAFSKVGRVQNLIRYPVKSMAGIEMESATIGWYGFQGDRRLAFRRIDDSGGFPWLSASRLPALVTYQPCNIDESSADLLPQCVKTPSGEQLDIEGEALRGKIAEGLGQDVELMHLKQGIFDDALISAITQETISHVCHEAGVPVDSRRFRPNIILDCNGCKPFAEDDWVDSVLVFGDSVTAPAIHVTKTDPRCMMINLDPDSGKQDANVMKAAVRLNDNDAGVYATVLRTGTIGVGDPVIIEIG